MGVLDDAIREHLELKRQHGVSEEELRRQEEEALGPARRDVAAAQGEEASAEAQAGEPEDAEEVTPDSVEHPAPETAKVEEEPPVAAPFDADEEGEVAAAEEPPHETGALAEGPTGTTPARGFESLHEDADEHEDDADEHEDDADEHEDDGDEPEDVLEDTPDFLQETPEHDRLWFEQKPPRDFDFD